MKKMDNFKTIEISKMVPAEWNYKDDDSERTQYLMESLKRNLKRNSQIQNMVVRKLKDGKYEVIDGNHRLKAFKELGIKEAVCYDCGDMPLAEAKKVSIALNETKFKADPVKLSEQIRWLIEKGKDSIESLAEALPYSADELKSMNELTKFDWSKYEVEPTKEKKGKEDFTTVSFKLPDAVADQLNDQIERMKKALYPNKDPEDVSVIYPIEAICQHLAQVPDDQLI